MKKLIKGIIDFRTHSLTEYRNKFGQLAIKQTPDTLFIACCDSRVVPNTFASTDPGDLFVTRNIGNLVPPHNEQDALSMAAVIEFSLNALNVMHIVICGHSECGAMQSFMNTPPSPDLTHVCSWLRYATPSYHRYQAQHDHCDKNLTAHNQLSQVNVLQQLEHLKTYPQVAERLQSGTLKIHGWWFDLATADVYCYHPSNKCFLVIDETTMKDFL